MSKTRSKGTIAENAVADFLNVWATALNQENGDEPVSLQAFTLAPEYADALSERYPDWMTVEQFQAHPDFDTPILPLLYRETVREFNALDVDWNARGLPFRRITSEGALDKGDVAGAYTMIEVKNYSNPAVGSLLKNAEWKAVNAQRPIWCLCWKAKGKGHMRVFDWHTSMTFKALCDITDIPYDPDVPPYELDGLEFEFTCDSIALPKPKYKWRGKLRVPTNKVNLDAVRDEIWQEELRGADDGAVIPFIVSPRRGNKGAELHHERWFAYTRLEGFARVIETFGILPQDEREYLAHAQS